MSESQYEFNEAQNRVIQGLSQKMKFVSIFLIVIGLLQVAGGILPAVLSQSVSTIGVEYIIGGFIYILIGVWGASAANSFQQVVDTEGNDIDHMMGALGNLKKATTLAYWLLIIFIILLVTGFIFGLMMAGGANPG
jgi:hypothetical protein